MKLRIVRYEFKLDKYETVCLIVGNAVVRKRMVSTQTLRGQTRYDCNTSEKDWHALLATLLA